MATLDKVLDAIMKLDFYSREMILDIIKKRQVEERRNEISKNAKRAKSDFSNGKTKSLFSDDVIKQLRTL